MRGVLGDWRVMILGGLAGLALAGCGSGAHSRHSASAAGPLKAFELPTAGTVNSGELSWTEYGARPVGKTLTINAVSVYNTGRQPLVLLGIRQKRSAPGLVFTSQLATVSQGFAGFSEYVTAGKPSAEFGLKANFSPVRGFLVEPDPKAAMAGLAPSLVLTAVTTKPGVYHIGDWIVTYRVGSRHYSLDLVDDGEFCAGAKSCPQLG